MIGDSGAYASVGMKVLERAAGHASGPYHVPTIDVESVAVRTNNPVCGAFRGFGANQAQFAMEGVLDRLAEQVGISGWEIRKRNVIQPGRGVGPGPDHGRRLPRRRALPRRDQAPTTTRAVAAGKAVGLGLGLKNSGLGNGFKEIIRGRRALPPTTATVEVRHCWTEMGQGVHTVALQVAVEELGIDPDRIQVIVDTTRELGAGQTTGIAGHADGRRLGGRRLRGGPGRRLPRPASTTRASTASTGRNTSATASSTRSSTPRSATPPSWSSSTARRGAIEQVVAVHDVGRAVNPLLCEGQIEGSRAHGPGLRADRGLPGRPRDRASRPT